MESYDCAVVVFVDERATRRETRGTERVVDVDGCHIVYVYSMNDVNPWWYESICVYEGFEFCSERALFA
jgi:hypothetical protein